MSQEREELQSPPLLTMAIASDNGNDEPQRQFLQTPNDSVTPIISNMHDWQTQMMETNIRKDSLGEENTKCTMKKTGSRAIEYHFDCNICLESVQDPVVTRCGHLYCWPCLYKWLEPGITPSERIHLNFDSVSTVDSGETRNPTHDDIRQQTLRYGQNNTNESSASRTNISTYEYDNSERIIDTSRRSCPVCKTACPLSSIVPIYVKNTVKQSNTAKKETEPNANFINTPLRPTPFLPSPPSDLNMMNTNIESTTRPSNNLVAPRPPPSLATTSLSSSFDQSIVPVLLGLHHLTPQGDTPNMIFRSGSLSSQSEVSTEEQREYTMMEDATISFLSNILIMLGSAVLFILLIF